MHLDALFLVLFLIPDGWSRFEQRYSRGNLTELGGVESFASGAKPEHYLKKYPYPCKVLFMRHVQCCLWMWSSGFTVIIDRQPAGDTGGGSVLPGLWHDERGAPECALCHHRPRGPPCQPRLPGGVDYSLSWTTRHHALHVLGCFVRALPCGHVQSGKLDSSAGDTAWLLYCFVDVPGLHRSTWSAGWHLYGKAQPGR